MPWALSTSFKCFYRERKNKQWIFLENDILKFFFSYVSFKCFNPLQKLKSTINCLFSTASMVGCHNKN